MNTAKRIVCLANSRKLSGRCIAGKELSPDGTPGAWVRPVSNREKEEVSEDERQYRDGSDPQVLDVMNVPVLRANPRDYQQENWLLDPEQYWEKIAVFVPKELNNLTDPITSLWTNGYNTLNGKNDKIPLTLANNLHTSLCFIRADELELFVSAPGRDFGNNRRRVQGRFQYNGIDYWLRVTDPTWERDYLRRPDGSYEVGAAFLTISLGEPFQGDIYKLIAAVISP